MANQQPADASLRKLVQQLVSLAIIYVLTLTTEGNLVNLCLALCASPLIVVLIFNFTFPSFAAVCTINSIKVVKYRQISAK